MTEICTVPLKKLTLDPRNARLHSIENIEAIKASLTEFGLRKPIIINPKNTVLAGNGTVRAARELGWEEITAIVFRGTNEQEQAFAIADNRSAELASWDQTGLAELLTSLDEGLLAAAGYTPMTVDDLIASIQESQEVTLPNLDDRFSSLATRSIICTYERPAYDRVVALFGAARAQYGFDSNSETLSHLLDIMIGEPA
jgi:hypothetical protein